MKNTYIILGILAVLLVVGVVFVMTGRSAEAPLVDTNSTSTGDTLNQNE